MGIQSNKLQGNGATQKYTDWALVSAGFQCLPRSIDYLLKHFSASWLLFTSLMILPLLFPTAWKRKRYLLWGGNQPGNLLLFGRNPHAVYTI